MTFTKEDLEVVAKTVWAEARGEGIDGMICVAAVIRNRLKSGKYSSYEDVCKRPYQFSCWLKSDPQSKVLNSWSWTSKDPSRVYALGSAAAILSELVEDPTGGATHYHTLANPRIQGVTVWPPSWAAKLTKLAVIGRHVFYKE